MNAHAHVKAPPPALGSCMLLRGLARLRARAHGCRDGRCGGAVEASVGRHRNAREVRAIGGTYGGMRVVVVVVGKSVVVVVGLGSDKSRRVGGW